MLYIVVKCLISHLCGQAIWCNYLQLLSYNTFCVIQDGVQKSQKNTYFTRVSVVILAQN